MKKFFNLKIVLLFTIVLLSFSTFLMFNPAVSEVIYSKIFPGNVLFKGNIFVAPATDGGNQGLHTSITGQPNLTILPITALTDGSTNTHIWMDGAETGWSAINARTVCSSDTDVWRVGDSSLLTAFSAAAVANDGAIGIDAGDQDLQNNESFGFWIYATGNLRAGDFVLQLVDVTANTSINVPAVKNRIWTWVELDISGIAAGSRDAVSDINFMITTAGAAAHGAIDIYVDSVVTWDVACESALGQTLVDNGVLDVFGVLTAAGSNNTFVALAEWTAYFTHYEDGVDFIVDITNNSTYTALAFLAYQ